MRLPTWLPTGSSATTVVGVVGAGVAVGSGATAGLAMGVGAPTGAVVGSDVTTGPDLGVGAPAGAVVGSDVTTGPDVGVGAPTGAVAGSDVTPGPDLGVGAPTGAVVGSDVTAGLDTDDGSSTEVVVASDVTVGLDTDVGAATEVVVGDGDVACRAIGGVEDGVAGNGAMAGATVDVAAGVGSASPHATPTVTSRESSPKMRHRLKITFFLCLAFAHSYWPNLKTDFLKKQNFQIAIRCTPPNCQKGRTLGSGNFP